MRSLLAALVLLIAAGGVAAAQPVVLQVHVGEPAPDFARRAGVVQDELGRHGFGIGVEGVGALLEERISRPGRVGHVEVKDILEQLRRGEELWYQGQFAAAAKALDEPLKVLRQNPALVSGNDTLRKRVESAQRLRALSLTRAGQPHHAREVMADRIRTFPKDPITRADHGPLAADLHDEVMSELVAAGSGRLSIAADDPLVDIFVNEALAGTGTVTVTVLPGEHRIYTQRGTTSGRVRAVQVSPGETTRVQISWRLDAILRTEARGVGLWYESEAERDQWLVEDVVAIGRQLGAPEVVVVSEGVIDGTRALIGTKYAVEAGGPRRSGGVVLDPDPGPDELRALGAYLADGPPAPRLRLLEPIPPEYRKETPRATAARGRWGKYATGAATLALAAGSVVMFSLDGKGTCSAPTTCPEVWDFRVAKWTLAGSALIGAGLMTYLFLDDARRNERSTTLGFVVTASDALVTLGGSF